MQKITNSYPIDEKDTEHELDVEGESGSVSSFFPLYTGMRDLMHNTNIISKLNDTELMDILNLIHQKLFLKNN